MTIRQQLEVDSAVLFLLALLMGSVFAFYSNYHPHIPVSLPVMNTLQPTPTPTIPQPEVTSQMSPDGTKVLTMTVMPNKNLSKTYTFVTSSADGSDKQTLYTATYNSDSLSIPFNAWSPDDTYVFILHNQPSGNEALVFKADGSTILDGQQYMNATEIFTSRQTGNVYDTATGWASDTLLIINSKTQNGDKSTSYWLEIPSRALIPLSTQF